MHDNAEISTNQNESRILLGTILSCQSGGGSSSGKSRDDVIMEMAISLQEKSPKIFDLRTILEQYPTK